MLKRVKAWLLIIENYLHLKNFSFIPYAPLRRYNFGSALYNLRCVEFEACFSIRFLTVARVSRLRLVWDGLLTPVVLFKMLRIAAGFKL